jgi:hypothetical protein
MKDMIKEPIIEEVSIDEMLEALCCSCSGDDDNPY